MGRAGGHAFDDFYLATLEPSCGGALGLVVMGIGAAPVPAPADPHFRESGIAADFEPGGCVGFPAQDCGQLRNGLCLFDFLFTFACSHGV